MIEPAIPIDDAARVADLRRLQVLDTPAEERFDRITRTAAGLFGVPMALVTLVDANRQWFKSRHGFEDTEGERRTSFCGHAVLQEGAFVIADALADARFADNPSVTGAPFVRFYAGMPLHGGGGHRIGTLCLIDRRPRAFTPEDERRLADLAAWAELELNVYTIAQATAVAREKEERLQAVVDHAGDGIVTLSDERRVLSFNPAAAQMFGQPGPGAIGRPVDDWVAPAARAALADFTHLQPRGAGGEVRREVECRRMDGSNFPAEIVVTRLRGTATPGFTLIVRDVSERKKVERMKDEFISTVSHELRTPLTSVRGSLGLLAGGAAGEMPPKARGLLDIAASNCDRLVRLINDMLDIEKIESGHIRFELASQSLLALARQAIVATEAFAQQHQTRYALAPGAADVQVLADPDRLTQVLVNLLSNAAKFSPAGAAVDVDVQLLGGPEPGRRVRLTVADRGAGIPIEFRERLFARFAQADASDARARSGTGLGLAISKAIVERLGGRIGFEDRPGGGTAFFIDLAALADAPSGAAPTAPPAGTTGPRAHRPVVLHVEDDADLARVVATLLQDSGDVVHAASLAQAREELARCAFDLLLLDLELPDGHGSQLLADMPACNASTPVIIFSGSEVGAELATRVKNALVKSRTSSGQLLDVANRLMATPETRP